MFVSRSAAKRRSASRQQAAMPFDRKDAAAEPGQNRGLVTRAGADLDHRVALVRHQRLGHQRHDIGLAGRLPMADRQRDILIGPVLERGRHEPLARRPLDRAEHPRIADPGAAQLHQQAQLFLREAGLAGSHAMISIPPM